MRPFKESSMASFAKEHGIYGKSIEEKIEEKVKSKYSQSVIENPPRNLMPRTLSYTKSHPKQTDLIP